jgi:OOP family OmpA-OmpF porin
MSFKSWLGPMVAIGATIGLGAASLEAATPLPAGWYVAGGGGLNQPRDVDNNVGGFERETTHDLGWVGAGSFGYAFQNGLRLELEGGYRDNGIDQISGAAGNGSVKNTSVLANLIYQYQTTGWVIPYVGFGVGGAHTKFSNVMPLGAGAGTTVNDSDWSMAYQGIVGMEYPVTENLGLDLSYRFLYSPNINMTATNGAGVDTTYQSHAVLVGLRWSLGAQKPVMAEPAPMPVAQAAPAPAPAPQPPMQQQAPRQYLVFFDWNSAVLTTEAQNIVRTAAASAKQTGITRIQLTGHADRSGPDAYNVRLSQRRADAVKAELVKNGVSANEISTIAKGESEPLVPTADGVREPQNRRVQIVFP